MIISLKWLPCRKIVAFVPYGLWGPEELVSTHGLIFGEFNDEGRSFKVVVLMYMHLIALTTSMMPTSSVGCTFQVAACVVLTVSIGLLYAVSHPLRWPILNWSRCTTLLLQATLLLMSILEVRGTPEQFVRMGIMVSCLVDGLLGAVCYGRGWVLWYDVVGALHEAQEQLQHDNSVGVDMSLIKGGIHVNDGGFTDSEINMVRPAVPKFGIIEDESRPGSPVEWWRKLRTTVTEHPVAPPANGMSAPHSYVPPTMIRPASMSQTRNVMNNPLSEWDRSLL